MVQIRVCGRTGYGVTRSLRDDETERNHSRFPVESCADDSFTSSRLWPHGAVLKAAGRPVRLPRREVGKKRLDLFEITLAIGHSRERPCPTLPNWETRWPMNHRRCRECAGGGEPANSFTTVRVTTKKRTITRNGRRTGRSRRKMERVAWEEEKRTKTGNCGELKIKKQIRNECDIYEIFFYNR
jgi:hypothetical protein